MDPHSENCIVECLYSMPKVKKLRAYVSNMQPNVFTYRHYIISVHVHQLPRRLLLLLLLLLLGLLLLLVRCFGLSLPVLSPPPLVF
jgi:hypothetical protein